MNTGLPQVSRVIPTSHLAAASTSLCPCPHHPCAKLAGPVPKLHSWEAECTIAAPSGRSPCPTWSLSQKSLSKWLPRGIIPYGNGHANSGTVSQGGDSIWSRMELLKTCVLIQCFSSAFSPLAWCFSASAGLQGKLSKKGRAWLLTRQLETSGHVYSGLIHREVNWSLPLHSLHEAHRGLQGVFYPGHKQ